jgi:NAD(P)-dependent dehydrogenase (short-subunit alcohol dehydrogenase family)
MPKGEPDRVQQLFDLKGRVALVTGGAGLLGYHHGTILAAAGAHVVLLDLPATEPASRATRMSRIGD